VEKGHYHGFDTILHESYNLNCLMKNEHVSYILKYSTCSNNW